MPLPPVEPNDEEKLEKEANDFDTPFSLPDEQKVDIADEEDTVRLRPELDPTHPITDAELDKQQLYDEGLPGAAGVSEPNANDAVIAYHPPRTSKK